MKKKHANIHDIIKNKPYLAWYTADVDQLSEHTILEKIFNYGDWEDVKAVFDILGIDKSAKLFKKTISGQRDNYNPVIKHFFIKFFQRHAPQYF